jgi:hypothetical protein
MFLVTGRLILDVKKWPIYELDKAMNRKLTGVKNLP